jgi:hypothetical protein
MELKRLEGYDHIPLPALVRQELVPGTYPLLAMISELETGS